MSNCLLRTLSLPLLLTWSISAVAQSLQPVSTVSPPEAPPSGGSGDSWLPIVSADGRYVLFSSTANNLVLITNQAPIPALIPATLNVYLRDRALKTTTLVSVNVAGTGGGNGDSFPVAISTNGLYALFESSAGDLVASDTNGATDVFLRDLVAGRTLLVSANTNGLPGNGAARSSAMTPDGHYVAFVSAANDLVQKDTNAIPDIFVRDIAAGVTVLASVGAVSTNKAVPVGSSESPAITPDGRSVAFYSTATNLVAGVPGGGDVYVRDLMNNTTTWASAGARGVVSNVFHLVSTVSYNQVISDDGQIVFYEASPANGYAGVLLRYNLATGTTDLLHTNAATPVAAFEDFRTIDITPDGQTAVFIANTNGTTSTSVELWEAGTGAFTVVSAGLDGSVPTNSTCDFPSVDSSGRFVVFQSSALNLTTNALAGDYHFYLRDLQAGTTALLDADTNGVGSPLSPISVPSLTADRLFVAFDCVDGNLVPNDRNHASDVFVRDLGAGATDLVSAHHPGLPTVTGNGPSSLALASISADGRFIAFASEADNLAANDTNLCRDIFVQDLATGKRILASVATNGFSGDTTSSEPAISPDGRYVAFTSYADNLVPGDNNNSQDVFVRDLVAGTTTLVSYNSAGTAPGAKGSYTPLISSGGRFVLFRSVSGNLAAGVLSGENLFLRDMQLGTNYALTKSGASLAAMTPDGRYVAYGSVAPAQFGVWDSQPAALIYTNALAPVFGLAITPDGKRIVLAGTAGLYAVDLPGATQRLIDPNAYGYSSLSLSADGRWLATAKRTSQVASNQIYLYDLEAGTNLLVNQSFNPALPPNGASDSCVISSDGRFVAYRSAATNIVANDGNGVPDIFVYDAVTGLNTLLTVTPSGGSSGNNRSLTPVFSGDGSTLCYVSWASDLTALDFNQSSDVFAFSFLTATLLPASAPGQGPWISWPFTPGKHYRVQFKDDLGDPTWTDLSGTETNSGSKAYQPDSAPAPGQRFYRINSF